MSLKIFLTLFFLLGGVFHSTCLAQCNCQELERMANDASDAKLRYAKENETPKQKTQQIEAELTQLQTGYSALSKNHQDAMSDLQRAQQKLDQVNQLQRENERLREEIRKLNKQNEQLEKDKRELELVKRELEQKIIALEGTVNSLKKELQTLETKLKNLEGILNCIQGFDEMRRRDASLARSALEAANEKFISAKARFSSASAKSDKTLAQDIQDVWAIYTRYKVKCQEQTCGPYKLSACDDYKTAQEHLNAAYMLSTNMGNITNQFGDNLKDKLNMMNELLLAELGQAIAKGDFNVRSDAKKMVEDLPHLIFTERRGARKAPVDTAALGGSGNAEIISSIRQIKIEYSNRNYAESLALYSRFNRFFELEELSKQKELLAEAKYVAGVILLWDLTGINQFAGMAIPSSWLAGKMTSLKTQREAGKDLLLEITRQEGISKELKEKVHKALSKTY